jgi:hypothetical protein
VDQDSFLIHRKIFYGRWLNNVRTYQKVDIKCNKSNYSARPGKEIEIATTIYNPYKDTVWLDNSHNTWNCFLEYGYILQGTIIYIMPLGATGIIIPPHTSLPLKVSVTAPGVRGEYKLFFSLRTDPFPGTRNSRMIDIVVE